MNAKAMSDSLSQEMEAMAASLEENYGRLVVEIKALTQKISAKREELRKQGKSASPDLTALERKSEKIRIALEKTEKLLTEMKTVHRENIRKLNEIILKVRDWESAMGIRNPKLVVKRVRKAGQKKPSAATGPAGVAEFRKELKAMLGQIAGMRAKRDAILAEVKGIDA